MMEPKIRLKGFSGEWNFCNISSITNRYDNLRVPVKETERISGNIPYYGANGIQDYVDGFTHDGEYILVAEDGANDLEHYPVQYVNGKVWVNNHAHVLQGKKEIASTSYLKYAISCLDIKSALVGGGRSKLNSAALMSLELNIPSLSEQEALGEFFQHVDSLIQSNEKKIESLKQVKAASLQAMFPQEGETAPRVRFKGFDGEWEKVLVGKMGTTYSGLSGKTKDDFGIGDARFVTFLNVLTNAKIDTSILEAVNVVEGEHQNEVKKGDLLFNTSSETPEEVGMCAVMDEDLEKVYLNSFCFGFRVTDENIDPTCVAYLMRSHIGRRIMSILAQGATRYNLSKNSFCKAELMLPKKKEEQTAIASYFTNLDSQITLQAQRLAKLKQIKSACLDNMFV